MPHQTRCLKPHQIRPKEISLPKDRNLTLHQAHLDLEASHPSLKGLLVLPAVQDLMDLQVLLDHLALQDLLVLQVQKDLLDLQAQAVLLDRKALLDQALLLVLKVRNLDQAVHHLAPSHIKMVRRRTVHQAHQEVLPTASLLLVHLADLLALLPADLPGLPHLSNLQLQLPTRRKIT